MTFLSLLPAVGSALVWVPRGRLPDHHRRRWKGVVLILVGVLVIGLIDNLLAPDPGRPRHAAARLCRPGLHARRHLALRHQRLRDRPADRRALHRRLDAVPRRAGRAPEAWRRPRPRRSADRLRRLHPAPPEGYGRGAGDGAGGMAFFQKLKERLFKSSSKLEEGLDAIIDEAPAAAPEPAAVPRPKPRPPAEERPGLVGPLPRAGEGQGARRRHAREPRGAADPVRHGGRDLAQGRRQHRRGPLRPPASARARSARCSPARSPPSSSRWPARCRSTPSGRRWCWWWASTARARPRPSASSPASSAPPARRW